jgi:hypothetical protein
MNSHEGTHPKEPGDANILRAALSMIQSLNKLDSMITVAVVQGNLRWSNQRIKAAAEELQSANRIQEVILDPAGSGEIFAIRV